ncbi:hypothetical protein F511_47725 [Dorcoceras hygrometricum]|uniref:Uncharacterized protein n=1 Tax=Dorcoceras hygrometricum TaxID=472368 RepID=A0A2Z6ZRB8_9LAMI|nr:hypothetical protein F511_47725 [Dorcoceras hygrometricum]
MSFNSDILATLQVHRYNLPATQTNTVHFGSRLGPQVTACRKRCATHFLGARIRLKALIPC